MEDYYALLEINQDAPLKEVKKAYRKKIREYHPDVNKSKGAEKIAKLLNQAYHILSDSFRRSEYDLRFSLFRSPSQKANTRQNIYNTNVTWTSVNVNNRRRTGQKIRIQTSDGYFDIEFHS